MKRRILVTIISIFLIGTFISQPLMRRDFCRTGSVEINQGVHDMDEGMDSEFLYENRDDARNGLNLDQDDFGGSWFDDFTGDSGVGSKSNVNLGGGEVLLNVIDNGSKSSRNPSSFAYSKDGYLTVSNCQSSDDDSVCGGNENHYVDLDSSGNQYVEFRFPTFGLTSTPLLGDVEFEYSIESGKSFNNPYAADYNAQASSWNDIGNPPNGDGSEHHVTYSLNKVSYDTVNEANGMKVRFGYDPNSDSGKLYFDFVRLGFITSYHTSGSLTSTVIDLPQGRNWSVLSVHKVEPQNTQVKVSVVNATSDQIIPGFENLTDSIIDISEITANSIRLEAWLQGNGVAIPRLGSWGLEWNADSAWRDGFTGNGRSQSSTNLKFSGQLDLADTAQTGELKSDVIEIPLNRTWSLLHFDRTVPGSMYLNISVHDGATDELLLREWNRTETVDLDISHIAASEHPEIYLHAEFIPKQAQSPILRSWAVNWSVMTNEDEENFTIELTENVPDTLYVTEDTPRNGIIDFSDYFSVPCADAYPPNFALEQISDTSNITLELTGSILNVTYLAENWTGSCDVVVNCSSALDLCGCTTNPFAISVIPVDDAPVWESSPPSLSLVRGGSLLSSYSLEDYVTDAEDDELGFELGAVESDISCQLDNSNHILLTHNGSFLGNMNITATVFQLDNLSHSSIIDIPLNVKENTPPAVRLSSPRNGAVISGSELTLIWETVDPDTAPEIITYTLYFGENEVPDEHTSGLEKNHMNIVNLTDGVTYYWSVIPFDELSEGICLNSTWSFTINRSTAETEIGYLSPANGAIINTTSLNLTWQVFNESEGEMQFEIYFGDSRDILSKIGTTRDRFFPLEELRENITYYWKVTPFMNGIQGRSNDGVWSFAILKNFTAIYTISWSVDGDIFTPDKGVTAFSFNLTVNNTGNNANTIRIHAGGELRDMIIISPVQVSLLPGTGDLVKITILVADLESGLHHFILTLDHMGPNEVLNLAVNITGDDQNGSNGTPDDDIDDNDDSNDDDDTDDDDVGDDDDTDDDDIDDDVGGEKDEGKNERDSIILPVLVIIVLFFVTLVAMFFIISRKRKRSHEDQVADLNMEIDSLKTDIVHVPTRGRVKATSMPHLQAAHGDNEDNGADQESTAPDRDAGGPHISGEKIDDDEGSEDEKDSPRMKRFDVSDVFLPKDPTKESTSKKGVLALPPANFLTITEEDRKVPIEEVFLMTPTGILLEYYSLERDSAIGEDVLASMLSAVTSFIIDSLSMVGRDEVDEGDLSIDMGGFSVMMAKGDTLNLVAITAHEKKNEVKEQLDKGVYVLEDVFGDIMEEWDGDMSRLGGVKPYIESLVRGELDIYIKKKKLASGQTSSYIPLSRVTTSTKTDGSKVKKGKPKKGLPPTVVIEISSGKPPKSVPGNMSAMEIEEWSSSEQPPPSSEIDDLPLSEADELSLDDVEVWGWTDEPKDE